MKAVSAKPDAEIVEYANPEADVPSEEVEDVDSVVDVSSEENNEGGEPEVDVSSAKVSPVC